MAGFEVTGWDRGGKVVFHMGVEAPNDVVAVLYATGHLRRTDGTEAVIKVAKVEARAVVRKGRKYSSNSGSTATITDPMQRKKINRHVAQGGDPGEGYQSA